MWNYEKRLQFPVKIDCTSPAAAKVIITQLGGPDGETAAAMRYLNQRYAMPNRHVAGLLTDIGTEELGHLEMIGAIVHQLTRNLTEDQIKTAGFDTYFVDHTTGVYLTAAVFGRRRHPGCLSPLWSSNPKAMRLLICLKIWRQMVRLRKNNISSKNDRTSYFQNISVPHRRRFSLPTGENRNAAFFMPPCYAVEQEKALRQAAFGARL